ncbi:hypothetical protein [Nocardia sp. R7R-8]|uniref:hypothetical protein n=1 Tax=Nocardia sp. R7R-8 TaxID=3459304 RepID=UPI00403D8C61
MTGTSNYFAYQHKSSSSYLDVAANDIQAIDRFNTVGTCALVHGWAQDIATLVAEPVDIISASALLHEVYSYRGAYSGLHTMMRTFPNVLKPYGFFVYRDVYAVDAPSLHEPAYIPPSTR